MAQLRQACRANPPCRGQINMAVPQSFNHIRVVTGAVEDEPPIPRVPDRRKAIEAEPTIDGMECQTWPTLQNSQAGDTRESVGVVGANLERLLKAFFGR